MRVAVTGGSGFVGETLTKHLLRQGWGVDLLVRPASVIADFVTTGDAANLRVHRLTESVKLRPLMSEIRPDLVVHLAALFVAEHRAEDVVPLVQANVQFGAELLDAMRESGCSRIVNTSTAWLHLGGAEYDPVCLYAATKRAFEDILAYYVAAESFEAITLELFDTYGPGDRRRKLLPTLFALPETTRLQLSPGQQLLDFVHVEDVAAAHVLAIQRLREHTVRGHERYAISSGQPMTLRDVVERVERVLGRAIAVDWGGRPYRRREVMAPASPAGPLPGWVPHIAFDEGLRRMKPCSS